MHMILQPPALQHTASGYKHHLNKCCHTHKPRLTLQCMVLPPDEFNDMITQPSLIVYSDSFTVSALTVHLQCCQQTSVPYRTIPYHLGHHGLDFATTSAEANSGWHNVHALLVWEWRVGSVFRCRWCTATATFLLGVHVCIVCAREKEREIELGQYVAFLCL